VNLPLDSLLSGKRSCELPPRVISFGVLVPKVFYRIAANSCENSDQESVLIHNSILSFFLGTNGDKNKTGVNKVGWDIDMFLLESADLWEESNALGISTSNDKDRVVFPLTRLWQPSSLVEDEILPIISNAMKNEIDSEKKESNAPKRLQVWDLGCGSGRDICFLAEEIKALYNLDKTEKDIKFIGMDRHKASKDRSTLLWKNRKIEDITDWLNIDLKKVHIFNDEVENNKDNTIFIIFAVRYLNLKLINYIASEECPLPLNTIYAMSHFCKIDDDRPWEFEHPKVHNVLQRNQLKNLFEQSSKWKIIKDEIVTEGADGDYGRPMIYFIAQRCD